MNNLQIAPNFFNEGSPFLNHPLLTSERTAKEVDFVIEALALSAGMRILDVGCGFGRHSLELARRGYRVLGIDPSATMIGAARRRAGDAFPTSRLDYICQAGETFETEEPFDAAIALFTTLGQVTSSGENGDLVGRVYDSLTPGGRFLVEVPQRAAAVANLKTAERFGGGDRYTNISRDYDSSSRQVRERFYVVDGDDSQDFFLQYKLYDRAELEQLLKQSGFQILTAFSGYEGHPLTNNSPIMLVSSIK